MRLDILGCGPVLQSADDLRNCSGYLVDRTILFDCGAGILRALRASGLTAAELRYVFLSHFHLDHVADLPLVLMARFLTLDKTNGPLDLYGPGSIFAWFDRMAEFSGNWIDDLPVRLHLAEPEVKIEGTRISAAKTGHTEDSLCYRVLDKEGVSLFYSGDAGYSHALADMARACDLALIEASNTEESAVSGHLTPQLAARIASAAGAKKLLLTHMYPDVTPAYALEHAAKHYQSEILLAKDGMGIEFDST